MTKYNTGQVYKAKIRVCGTRSSFEIMEGDLIKDIGVSSMRTSYLGLCNPT